MIAAWRRRGCCCADDAPAASSTRWATTWRARGRIGVATVRDAIHRLRLDGTDGGRRGLMQVNLRAGGRSERALSDANSTCWPRSCSAARGSAAAAARSSACFLGMILVAVVQNGLNLLGISPYAFKMVIGVIILVAITLSNAIWPRSSDPAARGGAPMRQGQRNDHPDPLAAEARGLAAWPILKCRDCWRCCVRLRRFRRDVAENF